MSHYSYSSYCQRPDEIDLSVYQFPPSARNSAVTSPAGREQQFLHELRNLRAGFGFNDDDPRTTGSAQREVPIRLADSSPSFTQRQTSPNSLHRTFSDSNVIAPYRNGREDPHWMANPPPPFASSRYQSLERPRNTSGQPERPAFFKCASPTPWQSAENLSNTVERIPKQRFFSPGPEPVVTKNEALSHNNAGRFGTPQGHGLFPSDPCEEERSSSYWNTNGMSTSYPAQSSSGSFHGDLGNTVSEWEKNGHSAPSVSPGLRLPRQDIWRQSEPPQRERSRMITISQPEWRPDSGFSRSSTGPGGFFAQKRESNQQHISYGGGSILDTAMQNRENRNSAIISPELEMDMIITQSYRGGQPQQRHSYAGNFSEFSRKPLQQQQQYLPRVSEGFRDEFLRRDHKLPVNSGEPEPSSVVSSPGLEMSIPFSSAPQRSLPNSPVVSNMPANPLRPRSHTDPMWELDNVYGMVCQDNQAYPRQRSGYFRNERAEATTPQRSTVTTPMYGRGTLNERQPEHANSASPVAWELQQYQPHLQPKVVKHTGILLNPNETRRTNKRVMFLCDSEVQRDDLSRFVSSPESADAAPPHVKAYDAVIEDVLSRFVSLSDQIGGDVSVMGKKLQTVFEAHRHFLWRAASQVKPTATELQKFFEPIMKLHMEMTEFKDAKRTSAQYNHLSAVVDGTPALAWVTIEKTPAPMIKEALDAAMFFLNRILKEFKDKDQKHVEWVKTFKELLETLHTFVRQAHTTGLVWNSAPGNAPQGAPAKPCAPGGPSAGGPPPPPPPPPPSDIFADLPKPAPSGLDDGRAALFAQLNKGEAVTSGLKKVTADMQTHKNPVLRGQGTVPSNVGGSASVASPARAAAVQHAPVIELKDGKQWNVEYHSGNKNIEVQVTDKKQSVYVYKCDNTIVQVKGKCNSVVLDSCKKTQIVFDALVAQCETINCQSVTIQTLGEMPTLSIQKTDGCQVYLSVASKDCEIVTSKSSEMNILVPEGLDGDFVELPVPEQFKTVYRGGKLVTTVSDII